MSLTSKLGTMSVLPAYFEIMEQTDKFNAIKLRQHIPGSPHIQTRSIYLRGIDPKMATQEAWQNSLAAEATPEQEHFPKTFSICKQLMSLVGGVRLGAVMIVELPPGAVIHPHADEGLRAGYYQRFHVMLSGEHIWLNPGIGRTHMKAGEIWWVDNNVEHAVKNPSSTEYRWVLIVDIRLN